MEDKKVYAIEWFQDGLGNHFPKVVEVPVEKITERKVILKRPGTPFYDYRTHVPMKEVFFTPGDALEFEEHRISEGAREARVTLSAFEKRLVAIRETRTASQRREASSG